MQPAKRPIAITLGDPAGIGPEVLARFLHDRQKAGGAGNQRPLLIIGPEWALAQGAEIAEVELDPIPSVATPELLREPMGILHLGERPKDFRLGQIQAACGALAVAAVEQAARLCLDGRLDAMVTCPLHKEAIHAAGFEDDIGHQEILARIVGTNRTATLLMTPGLKVVHLSTHKSLIEAAHFVTQESLLEKLHLIHDSFGNWGMTKPHIAVAALNPHGGEGGLLGREEIDIISPAVRLAVAEGLNISGPIPADSIFNRAIANEFDVVLALYHDQGHIAIKVHNFHQSTTATLGLPFIRTSVDHGTAFDIAGRGLADARSLKAAVDVAEALVSAELAQL